MSKNENRALTKIATLFNKQGNISILKSSSDIGVIRNFGRAGSRYAPKAICHQFKSMTKHSIQQTFRETEISSQELENQNFNQAQIAESQIILEELKLKKSKYIHLGGGHDHIYPMLIACEQNGFKNIIVLNLDAHCDTRIDGDHHSGTPFRQFDDQTKINFKLVQYGIHSFANSESTLSPLKSKCEIFFADEVINFDETNINKKLAQIFDNHDLNTAIILSLDCDAIDSMNMEAVSAVNHSGISAQHINSIVRYFAKLKTNATKIFGVYEYNPVYDNLSNKGSRLIAKFIYDFSFIED